MYQALYRKYRPKDFNDVVGQNVTIQTLKNALVNHKISHAYLFAGPRGSGKTSIAKIFARLVNCEKTDGLSPCGECVFCTQSEEQTMDIIEMDAASNNGVDEIREINNKVNLVPSIGKYKIYIIDEVHMLTIGAFNALLKTLEEPPAHVIFILATTDPHKVPITILSRCQRFDFKKLSEENILSRLKYICEKEQIEIENEAISEIARLGDGSLRDAIGTLDQVIAYANDKITLQDIYDVNGTISTKDVYNLMDYVIKNNISGVVNSIKKYNDQGKSIVKITEEIILFMRNVIINKSSIDFPGNKIEEYNMIAESLSLSKIIEMIQILNQALLDMKKFSNPKLILELAFIKIINLNQNMIDEVQNNNVKNIELKEKNKSESAEIKLNYNENSIVEQNNKSEIIEERKLEKIQSNEKILEGNNNDFKNKEYEQELKTFVKIRVGNTLSKFSKKSTLDLKNRLDKLMDYLMDEDNNMYATMILDGNLKAVGDEYIIFTYSTNHLANNFNENIIKIENLLLDAFNINYKVVAVDDEDWNVIKEQFNSKSHLFTYKEEEVSIQDILNKINKKDDDSIKSLFGELVEYK